MSLQVWLPFNGSVENQGLIGNFTIGTSPVYATGKMGQAISSGSLTMSANQTASVLNNGEVSLCFWINQTGTTRTMIFGNSNMGASNNRKFSIFQYPSINDLHISWMNDTANATFISGVIYGAFPSNTWVHCAITYKNPTCKIYLNGELKATYSGISDSASFAYDTQLIHNNPDRLLNDFRIYNHCLSEKEIKEISKGLCIHYPLRMFEGDTAIVSDASGFNHTAQMIGTCRSVSASGRNGTGFNLTSTGTVGMETAPTFITAGSVSFWAKMNTVDNYGWVPFSGTVAKDCYFMASAKWTNGFYCSGNTASSSIKYYVDGNVATAPINDGKWHMYTITGISFANWDKFYVNCYSGWICNVDVSDIRVYATTLSADDVLDLYKVASAIDKTGNIFAYEFVEGADSVALNKTGVWNIKGMSEYHIEPDGSIWMHIAHHSNPTSKLFTKPTDITGTYIDEDRWLNLNICKELTSWEFLYTQKNRIIDNMVKYRWIQTVDPYTATYDNVKPSAVTAITTTGYSSSGQDGGIYRHNVNSEFVIANNSNGDWYGAIGCWSAWGGGIPGHYPDAVRTGEINLYVRVDTQQALIQKLGLIEANQFYEF